MTETSKKIFADEVVNDVQYTWSIAVSDGLQQVGCKVFQRLFITFPAYQQLFRPFKDIPVSELMNNVTFKRHALIAISALNTSIENLENPEKLVSLLKGVGKKHVQRNITDEHFAHVQKIIFETIGDVLGDRFTSRVASSWNEVLAVAVSTIMKGAQEEESKYI